MKWVTYKGSSLKLEGLKEDEDFKRLPFFIEEEGLSEIIPFIYEEENVPKHIKELLR